MLRTSYFCYNCTRHSAAQKLVKQTIHSLEKGMKTCNKKMRLPTMTASADAEMLHLRAVACERGIIPFNDVLPARRLLEAGRLLCALCRWHQGPEEAVEAP